MLPPDERRAGFPEIAAEVLTRGCRLRFRAEGRSMLPTLRPGDVLLVDPCSSAEAWPGDVLLYRAGSRLLAHRLVRKQEGDGTLWLVLQGDAPWQGEERVPAAALLGRVSAVERADGPSPPASRPAAVSWLARLAWRARRKLGALRAAICRPGRADSEPVVPVDEGLI